MTNIITENLLSVNSVGIVGHMRPDGDCIGSAMGVYNYITEYYPNITVDVYLGEYKENFNILKNTDKIQNDIQDSSQEYDVLIILDCGAKDRIGCGKEFFDNAKLTINIDHHISNEEFADKNHVVSNASSTCEVVYGIIGEEAVTVSIAECIYVGIIHDTGGLRHSNTTVKTFDIVSRLINMGINFSYIMDHTFYKKSYTANQLLGMALLESVRLMDNKVIFSVIKRKQLDFFCAKPKDVDGIIDQLRITEGIEVAILLYELESLTYKVSMRSNGNVDVCGIASFFNGGGHTLAAGCTMQGQVHDIVNNLTAHIEKQLKDLVKK